MSDEITFMWWSYFHRHKDEILKLFESINEEIKIVIDIQDVIQSLNNKQGKKLLKKISLDPSGYLNELTNYIKLELYPIWVLSKELDIQYNYTEVAKKFGSHLQEDVQWLEDPKNFPTAQYLVDIAKEKEIDVRLEDKTIAILLINLPDDHYRNLNEINVHNMPNIITVEGIVRGISPILEKTLVAMFECGRCGERWEIIAEDEFYKEPYECPKDDGGCGRKGPSCNWIRVRDQDVTTNYQIASIQDSPKNIRGSAQPTVKRVILEGAVVEVGEKSIGPGDLVKLIVSPKKVHKKFQGQKSFLNEIWLNCLSVEKNESQVQIDITEEDIKEFQKIKKYALDEMMHLLSLEVQGEEEVIYGLALHITGGVTKKLTSGHIIRGPVHILLIGDPGVAKSHLLHVLESLIPKSVFVSGKGASEKGIIAAAIKDPEAEGGYNLEAGAMVLADRSSVLVDEVDKMDDGVSDAMLEPMESQMFTVHKGPFHVRLNTRCGVVAVGNPKHGKFKPEEYGTPIIRCVDQRKMPPPWIERIDLSFPMYDIPEEKRDRQLFRAIIGNICPNITEYQKMSSEEKERKWERIKKYAWYARNEIHPEFKDMKLLEWIEDEYIKMRKPISSPGQSTIDDQGSETGITRRHIITIVRLCEARAKWFLRSEILKEDAEIALKLLNISLQQTTGGDLLMFQDGFTREERSTFELVYDAIKDNTDDERYGALRVHVIEQLAEHEMEENEVKSWFKILLDRGYAEYPDQKHIKTIQR